MPSDDLLKRLEALNGGPLAARPRFQASTPVPKRAIATSNHTVPPVRTRGNLEALLNLDASSSNSVESHLEIVRPISAFLKGQDLLSSRVRTSLETRGFSGAVFLDLETLGLKNDPLFLVGLLVFSGDGVLQCRQQFARNLSEEPSIIRACASILKEGDLLITFNGILFDVPFLRRRSAAHGIRFPRISNHHDVLAQSRIRLAGEVRDFRLKTLENHLCGRKRTGDIPGGEIPRVYSAFQRTGDGASIVRILEHNALDLITTADLFTRL